MLFMYGLIGVVIVMILYMFFFVMLIIWLFLFSLDVSMVNVVCILGMLMIMSVFKVILFWVINGIVVGFLLVVFYILLDFGILVMMCLDMFIWVIYVEYNVFGLSCVVMLLL